LFKQLFALSLRLHTGNRLTVALAIIPSCLITCDSCVLGTLITSFIASLSAVRPVMSLGFLSFTKVQHLLGLTECFCYSTQRASTACTNICLAAFATITSPLPFPDLMKLYSDATCSVQITIRSCGLSSYHEKHIREKVNFGQITLKLSTSVVTSLVAS